MGTWTKRSLGILGAGLLTVSTGDPAWSQPDCAERLPVERTSIELRGADIPTTLRLLAQRYRVNLLLTEEVAGAVTLSFFDVPVRDVFRTIVESANLRCVEKDGVLLVSTSARHAKQEADRSQAEQARRRDEAETRRRQFEAEEAFAKRQREEDELRARGPLREETIKLAYADAEDVAQTLQGILGIPATGAQAPVPGIYQPLPPTQIPDPSRQVDPSRTTPFGGPPVPPPPPPTTTGSDLFSRGLTIRAHKPTNSVFIRYYANDLERIKKLVKESLDIPLPQVQIAAQIVVTSRNSLEQLGVQWGGNFIGQGQGRRPTLVGTGLSQSLNSLTGQPQIPTTGTPTSGVTPFNPNFTPSLPIDPTFGLPTGGNIVNLPVSFLPTLANPAAGVLFGIVGRSFNLNIAIQALEVLGRARTLSEPKVVTVENSRAVISRGFEVPYVSQTGFGGTQVQFKDALLKLEVTPSVIQETGFKRIKMKILVEDNNPDFTRQVQGNPPIFKRRAEVEVVIREGERVVVGGVLVENDVETKRQVPVLGNIPILGWLFKAREINTDAQELIVVITPTVIPVTTAAR
jgi:type IV pilus assembly protein PilQ